MKSRKDFSKSIKKLPKDLLNQKKPNNSNLMNSLEDKAKQIIAFLEDSLNKQSQQ